MPRTISKNTRVLALIATMAAASFAVGGLVYGVTASDAHTLTAASTRLSGLSDAAASLTADLADQHASLADYVLAGNLRSKMDFDSAVAREAAAMGQMRALAGIYPSIDAAVVAVANASEDWRENLAGPAMRGVAAGNQAAIERFRTESVDDQEGIHASLDALAITVQLADNVVANRKVANEGVQNVGIVIAFGFLLVAFGVALVAVRRFGRALERDARQANALNQFTEVTSFAADDREIARASLSALARLVRPDASVVHILNRSMDRAVPESTTGDATAEILPMHALGRCAGVLRGTVHVTDDLSDDLSVHCPIYPSTKGTLACIPLISGESVGAVHLYWERSHALPLVLRQGISRITEHAALAIGNRRLLAALHGQANTDARTGLSNSRAFDLSLETALHARRADESLSVLMLDVDHFKQFNDRHGHPAGDEALKAFAAVLRSCMRDGDVAARYGGEEFAVFLQGIDRSAAVAIGERIRARTEATIISLAPGITDRITISIGVASAPDQGADRVTLLRLADEALYQAKELGRNRVIVSGHAEPSSLQDVETDSSSEVLTVDGRPRRPHMPHAASDA
jgi:diguanylate cyclase (GGDEF)-like protein